MKERDGYTVIEMLVVLAILALMSAFAVLAGASMVTSSQVYRGIARVTYNIALSREQAIGRYEQWRVRLLTSGSSPAQEYVVESCTLPVATPGQPCTAGWVQQGQSITMTGVGLQATAGGQPVTQLIFDRTGQFYVPDTSGAYQQIEAKVTVCTVAGSSCGTSARNVVLAQFSGMISVQ
jgi:prepilin-type N-terminal cleavage/methylation domain-containing protein